MRNSLFRRRECGIIPTHTAPVGYRTCRIAAVSVARFSRADSRMSRGWSGFLTAGHSRTFQDIEPWHWRTSRIFDFLPFPLIPSRLRSWRGLEPWPNLRGVRWRKTMIGQCRLSWKGACVSGGDVWGIGDFWMAHETVRQTNGARHQNLGGIDNRREAVQVTWADIDAIMDGTYQLKDW